MSNRIKEERIARGWKLEFVAAEIGTTVPYIQMIEADKRKPSFEKLVKLEDLFKLDYRILFNLPERQTREKQEKPDGNRAEESHKNDNTKKDKSI